MRRVDLSSEVVIGRRFGDWEIVSTEVRKEGTQRMVLVKCCRHDPVWKNWDNLRTGKSSSCIYCPRVKGWEPGERRALRNKYYAMMGRCYNEEDPNWVNYGGRGIDVEDFLQNVDNYCDYIRLLPGYTRDDGSHIDRIDNNLGYYRGNLRIVSAKENQRNRSNNRIVVVAGLTMCYTEFLENHTYMSETGAKNMVDRGVALEDLPRIPPGRKSKYYADYKSGVLRPKPPFDTQEWLTQYEHRNTRQALV